MNADARIKLGLGRPAFQGNAQALHDFRRVRPHHVASHDLVGVFVDQHLHKRLFIAPAEGVLHRTEAGDVHGDVAVKLVQRLLFCEANGGHGGLREDRGGNLQ